MVKKYWIGGIAALLLSAGLSLSAAAVSRAAELPDGIYVGSRSLGGLSEEKAKQAVEEYVDSLAQLEITLELDGTPVETTGGELGLHWVNHQIVGETVKKYADGNLIERFLTEKKLSRENVRIPLTVAVEEEKLADFVKERCRGIVDPAQDASITRINGEFTVTPSASGKTIDLEAAKKKIDYTLEQGLGLPITVSISVEVSEPGMTEQELRTIGDMLGTFSVRYSRYAKALAGSIEKAAEKLNGQVVMPGRTLSGYECLQPFTAENGYVLDDKDTTGQVPGIGYAATALYNASLRAELEITQRHHHPQVVKYVKPSEDAAITGADEDIKITNNYETPIYIEAEAKRGILTINIYGRDTRPGNRKIAFKAETLETIKPGKPITTIDNSLAPGARITEQTAHKGTRSRLWKIVSVDGVETERIILNTDTYDAAQTIYRVGPRPGAQPSPPEPPAAVQPVPAVPEPSAQAPQEEAVQGTTAGNGAGTAAEQPEPTAEQTGSAAGQTETAAEQPGATAEQTESAAEQTAAETPPQTIAFQ